MVSASVGEPRLHVLVEFPACKVEPISPVAPRETADAMMSGDFVKRYASTRVILDATEVQCEVPTSPLLQSSTH